MLKELLKDYTVILASASSRRKDILEAADIDIVVAPNYAVDESYPSSLQPEEVAEYISIKKSEGYPLNLSSHQIVLTADTIVVVGDKILGKPKDRDEAIAMLFLLSGKSHRVITAFTLRTLEGAVTHSAYTTVWFKPLLEKEIVYYVDKYRPFDKAGSYGIQEWIGYIGIERVEGSYFNVVGLPIQRVCEALTKLIQK